MPRIDSRPMWAIAACLLAACMASSSAAAQAEPGSAARRAEAPPAEAPSEAAAGETQEDEAPAADADGSLERGTGSAQALDDSVVLLLPDAVRAPWSAAIEYELGLRNMRALGGEALAPPTQLIGDGAAQLEAHRQRAAAALWVRPVEGALELRLVRSGSTRAHAVRVAEDADGRTVALIVTSLLDLEEGAEVPVVRVRAYSADDAAEPRAAAGLSPPSSEPADSEGEADSESEATPERGHHVRWSGRVGLAGFGIWSVGTLFEPGAALRAGMGLRYAGFELAVMHDLGFWTPQQGFGSAVQPFGRACLDVGLATPRAVAAFHGGVRGCAGSIFATEIHSLPEVVVIEGPRTHMSGGTYAAVSFRVEEWVRIFVRADIELGWTQLSQGEQLNLVPTLSTYVSFT